MSGGAKRSLLIDALARDFKADLETDGKSPAEVADLLARSRARIEAAPLAIILCMDASSMDKYPDARRIEAERIMAIQSTANAGYALLLAAHAEGLGAAWNCAPLFAPRSVAAALRLPSTWNPQALFLIGYAADVPRRPNRMSIDKVSLQI